MPYKVIKDIRPNTPTLLLRSGGSLEIGFSGQGVDLSAHHRLFFTCEDRMSTTFKEEGYGDKLYQLIEDALDTKNAVLDRYCLNLSEDMPRPFVKCAAVKRVWDGVPKMGGYSLRDAVTDTWELAICAKAQGLTVQPGGYIRLRLEWWDRKPGVAPQFTGNAPDHTEFLEIPTGTYEYTRLSRQITIPKEQTACVMVTVEGLNYSGGLYLEQPELLSSNNDNLLPKFDVAVPCLQSRFREPNWTGMNLAQKEWPRFKIELNGKTVFEGEKYLRVHRFSPVEILLPDGVLAEENQLKITYTSNYRDTVPLELNEIKILQKPKAPLHLHYVSTAVAGQNIPLLIETEQPDTTVTLQNSDLHIVGEHIFPEPGLQVLQLAGDTYHNGMPFTLMAGDYALQGVVERAVERPEDNVVVGSGDLVYIDHSSKQEVMDFLEWAVANRTHNFITLRPVYRWGGQRFVDPTIWPKFTQICDALGIDYVHMLDGRDLPGVAANPSEQMMQGKRFLGRQLHERDGQAFYWNHMVHYAPVSEVYMDLAFRQARENPQTIDPIWSGTNHQCTDAVRLRRYDDCRPDMREAHDCALATLKNLQKTPRHTGPSVMFKYLYEAGFQWVGAETMDSSTETLLAFMRGASKAYGKHRTGVHHAVQWSTRPHDTLQRYHRFMLANYVSYLQGVTDINTEEGLWFLECQYSYHNRFSDACVGHSDMQRKLYEFIRTHARTGRYYTPTAFVHGRYDGWYGFHNSFNLFGMSHIQKGEPEQSWNLLNVFYPQSVVNRPGVLGYFPEGYDKPIGLVSGTPNGNVDVVPVEKSDFSEYKLVCFTGYNAAEAEDMERLYTFVAKGGTLLAAWPHFSTVTYRPDIDAGKVSILSCPLTDALTAGRPHFVNGACVNLTPGAKVSQVDQNGQPLVVEVTVGKGKVVLVNRTMYPGNPQILPLYQELVTRLNGAACAEDLADISCGDDVQFARYMQPDGSMHLYLTAVDWYRDPAPARQATLRVGEHKYDVTVPFGDIVKIVVKDGVAAWPRDMAFEVLCAAPLKVQGKGTTTVYVAQKGICTPVEVNMG